MQPREIPALKRSTIVGGGDEEIKRRSVVHRIPKETRSHRVMVSRGKLECCECVHFTYTSMVTPNHSQFHSCLSDLVHLAHTTQAHALVSGLRSVVARRLCVRTVSPLRGMNDDTWKNK
ncbi:hypothetical protein NECAME_04265 [Necator americanus]|uniref:Uncharacterized protein n=1 Tax=Necator americanus TaxID=51031 RepID=W2SV07_NECAM|nr:hypothetical protein NECAME_04265 [Necator americanus]ETN73579.1 hypothetical protein NECAME_04265 [Necator americanus]